MTIDLNHTFVTSDHHFSSFKLPGFLKVFTEEQEKELIDKWNRTVGKDDLRMQHVTIRTAKADTSLHKLE